MVSSTVVASHKCCTASFLLQRSTFRAIVWPKQESGMTCLSRSLIIDDRAACRNLHTSTRSRSLTMLPNQRTDPFTQRKELIERIGWVFSHCRGRECEKLDSGPGWRGFYARWYDEPSLSLAIQFQSKYGRRISFASHKLEAPRKEDDKKKRRGPSVLLVR